jgi:hypothetical protein
MDAGSWNQGQAQLAPVAQRPTQDDQSGQFRWSARLIANEFSGVDVEAVGDLDDCLPSHAALGPYSLCDLAQG